ncbi:MAG: Imm26 family immunity protein [Marinagarivorans sp.]
MPDIYFWGRVVSTDARIGNLRDVILVYIYRAFSRGKADIPQLDRNDLMFAPFGINQLPWSKGFFETVKNVENGPEDLLSCHCFRWVNPVSNQVKYVNEYGERLEGVVESCGIYAMRGYVGVDKDVSEYVMNHLGAEKVIK